MQTQQQVINSAARSARKQVATVRLQAVRRGDANVQRDCYAHLQALRTNPQVQTCSDALCFVAQCTLHGYWS